jgi:hypothetical protein
MDFRLYRDNFSWREHDLKNQKPYLTKIASLFMVFLYFRKQSYPVRIERFPNTCLHNVSRTSSFPFMTLLPADQLYEFIVKVRRSALTTESKLCSFLNIVAGSVFASYINWEEV